MVDFAESVKGALKGGLCAVLGADEAAVKLLSRLTGSPIGAYPLASGLRRQLCSDDPGNDPVFVPSPATGQCPVVYRAIFNATGASGACNPIEFGTNNVGVGVGPISIREFHDTALSAGFGGLCPGYSNNVIYYTNASGEFTLVGQARGIKLNSLSLVREDGGPDNCGTTEPPVIPPGPVPITPTNITYDIDVNTQITVPLTAVFAPVFLSFDGSIKVPVTVNVDGLNFDGTVTISPEFEVNIKPTINIGGPGDVDDPDVIGEPGGGPTEIPDSQDLDSTIIGVLVYSDVEAEAGSSSVAFTNGPQLYVPRLASVQFAVKTRDSIGWTSDLDVKNLECYVPCPAPQGAIAVRVSPMPGVQSRFTAVRGIPLTSF